MKSIRKIIALCVIVVAIIAFWLIPGVNTAKETTYVRRYEDTSLTSDSLGEKRNQKTQSFKPVREQKLYKTEKIRSKDKFSKIRPSMYSRAVQFEELEAYIVLEDSIRKRDSLRSFALRNMKMKQVDTATVVH